MQRNYQYLEMFITTLAILGTREETKSNLLLLVFTNDSENCEMI